MKKGSMLLRPYGRSLALLIVLASLPTQADSLPRTSDGKPNLEGTWDFRSATPLEAPRTLGSKVRFTEEQARDFEAAAEDAWRQRTFDEPWADRGRELSEGARASLIIDPPTGRLPVRTRYGETLAGKWRKLMAAQVTDNPEDRTVLERCIVSSSIPLRNSNFNNNVQIVQTPTHVVIHTEMVHEARIAPFGGASSTVIRQWNGMSYAKWEGDALVVTTTGFREAINRIGTGHDMVIQERFSLTGPDVLRYDYTVHDPAVFTASWTARQTLKRTQGRIYEYACHEGNESIPAMLRGSRLTDRLD